MIVYQEMSIPALQPTELETITTNMSTNSATLTPCILLQMQVTNRIDQLPYQQLTSLLDMITIYQIHLKFLHTPILICILLIITLILKSISILAILLHLHIKILIST